MSAFSAVSQNQRSGLPTQDYLPAARQSASPAQANATSNQPKMQSGGGFANIATIEASPSAALYARQSAPALPAASAAPDAATTDATATALERPVLLYNAGCQICQAISSWVKRQDARGQDQIDERAIGSDPSALAALNPNLDIWQVYEKIHMVMPNGDIKVGGAAIAEIFKRLPATKWFAPVFDVGVGNFKPFQSLLNVSYEFLDAIRPALGCESCGGGPVAWWAKPIKWAADGVKTVAGLFRRGESSPPAA